MGADVTAGALRWQFAVPIREDVKRLQAARAAGIECQTIVLRGSGCSSGGKNEDTSQTFLLALGFHLRCQSLISKSSLIIL